MKQYKKAEMEIIFFEAEDVITVSNKLTEQGDTLTPEVK